MVFGHLTDDDGGCKRISDADQVTRHLVYIDEKTGYTTIDPVASNVTQL